MKKINDKSTKVVGVLNEKVAIDFNLQHLVNRMIYKKYGFYKHIFKHIGDFKSLTSYEIAINNIENIILNPELVYYNEPKNTLEYYKCLEEYVCLTIDISKEDCIILTSLYPVSIQKVNNKRDKYFKKKYIVNFGEEEYNRKIKQKYLNKKK